MPHDGVGDWVVSRRMTWFGSMLATLESRCSARSCLPDSVAAKPLIALVYTYLAVMPCADATRVAEPALRVTMYCPATSCPLAAATGMTDCAWAGVAAMVT